VGCRAPSLGAAHSLPPALERQPPQSWARATLDRLSLEEKAAQLIAVRADVRDVEARVGRLKVGGLVVFDADVRSLPRRLNALQAAAEVPLLVAADMERGMAFRLHKGVVPLPYAMAIGATRSEDAARFTGEVAAREGRALGIHWAFAPVADVNSNPANPVINIRSYGEDPELAARLAAAFIRGAHTGGLLTTVKHFPGHGDTNIDTHLRLATIASGRARLEAVELLPFRRAVASGVDSVMVGHIAVPALDPSGAPATLSAPVTGLLRGEMSFHGLVVTDALEMAGARGQPGGDAAVRAVLAGADFILLPLDPEATVAALVRAVREGVLTERRLDVSVLRLLETKQRIGLDRRRSVDEAAASRSIARPEDLARAQQIAEGSITLVRNDGGVLPLHPEGPLRILHLVLSSDAKNDLIQGIPEAELRQRGIAAETVELGPVVSEATTAALLARARDFSHVLASCFVKVTASKGTAEMAASHAALLRALAAAGRPVVVVSYGSPYLLRQFPGVPVYVCAYGSAESSQRAAVAALFGEYALAGKLPVTLAGLYPYGHGIELPRRNMMLRAARPEDAGFRPEGLTELDRTLEAAVANRVAPGAVVAVGKDGALVHLRAFGRLSYDPASAAVEPDTIYDLASLTKVVVTATMAMMLVDEGKLDLDQRVSAVLPAFRGAAKGRVRIADLLSHSAGLAGTAPLYKEVAGREAYLERIAAMNLEYEPGSKSVYSDLGPILMGEILERVAGEPLDSFARRRICDPLGMKDTGYRPARELLARIAPTEDDSWRGRLLHGEVHDENAFALGGVAPLAGLFGTAPDLARFAQMLLNGGVWDGRRIVSRQAVERFTRRVGIAGSSRALGWDTPSTGSSAGTLLSPRSFGHTGFTGTSIWIDPERRLFVILLTNRVHPTRDNDAHLRLRPAVADAVVRGLAG
jgi:beta-glucosidase-like glycosyl hydrolase/CubicO group peptidase (beta-lactamase class C family)